MQVETGLKVARFLLYLFIALDEVVNLVNSNWICGKKWIPRRQIQKMYSRIELRATTANSDVLELADVIRNAVHVAATTHQNHN